MSSLPQTGTAALLNVLSPYLDDDFIDDLFRLKSRRGKPRHFRPSQLFRVLLLNLLTPVHSFNLLVQLLPEHRPWRDFAHLPNKRVLPDAKMLHQFRDKLTPITLRAINRQLLMPLVEGLDPTRMTIAIIDATDLPASTNTFKKNNW